MARGRVSISFKGVKELHGALEPGRVQQSLRRHMRKATALNALAAQKAMREEIQNGNFAKNAPLTVAIKGSSKPLVGNGDLFKSITHIIEDDFTAFVGVMRSDANYDIAKAVHDGFQARVTPAMRGLFFVLWLASSGGMDPSKLTGRAAELFERFQGWKPLSNSTSVIITPPRRFVRAAFESSGLKSRCQENWQMALGAVFKEMGSKIR